MENVENILNREILQKEDIISLLSLKDKREIKLLLDKGYEIKKRFVGNKVYYRGLIEYSNLCAKDCNYCGIRVSNKNYNRYTMEDREVVEAATKAYNYGYGSIVLQSGERSDNSFVKRVESLLKKIKNIGNGKLGITLSVGEQSEEVYRRFFDAGAHRFLLRIETTNRELYSKIHPKNQTFENRLKSLELLKKIGYQTGTGVMIGLPNQTIEDLAEDLIFFREFDIDMVGMGPFIEAENTPMYINTKNKDMLPKIERFNLTLRMIAVLRIMMKDINIASSTALQTLVPDGREQGLRSGSNVIMPNLTPFRYRENYKLYDKKPSIDEENKEYRDSLDERVKSVGDTIGYNEWGDSPHFKKKKRKTIE
ncbi:MAG: [FeFe] hydrogenase H-cluster radical SAM maturase HydE [Candidatus Cloacimonadota bacterium]|nr:MAG: [FeFe] hydrogenase H-cluster radical SAM maturase HydE [Candidatus Cloacimonadota bacterium]PIE78845.1 MAG: [FeFe] hydrogenase H-cluster radical SAM maturase HydE [Candidatus Delongbacteria bacterium]